MMCQPEKSEWAADDYQTKRKIAELLGLAGKGRDSGVGWKRAESQGWSELRIRGLGAVIHRYRSDLITSSYSR